MKKLIFFASFVSALFITTFADAQVNRNQHVRIQQGVRHGQLTKNEALQLRIQQERIRAMKKRAMADGVITARERKMIRDAQKQASVAIYNKKHDRNVRW